MTKAVHLFLAVLCPFTGGAQAQTSDNVFGLHNVGVLDERICAGCESPKLTSGGTFRGDDADRPHQDGMFARQAYVGADNKLGVLTIGRQYNPQFLALTDGGDPFQDVVASAANRARYTAVGNDSTVQYATSQLHGLSASAIYSFGETTFSSVTNRAYGATLGYADGPVTLSISHQRKSNYVDTGGPVPFAGNSASNSLVAAKFNFGASTAYAAYGHNQGAGSLPWNVSNPYGAMALSTPSTDSRDVLMGVAVPLGATTLLASYIRKDDRNLASQDAHQLAVGFSIALSTHTDLYASYAKIKNKNGVSNALGNATEPGRGDSALNVGLWHSF